MDNQLPEAGAENWLSIDEVVKVLKVSRRTVHNYLKLNKLEFVRTPGGSPRIKRESLFHVGNPPAPTVEPTTA